MLVFNVRRESNEEDVTSPSPEAQPATTSQLTSPSSTSTLALSSPVVDGTQVEVKKDETVTPISWEDEIAAALFSSASTRPPPPATSRTRPALPIPPPPRPSHSHHNHHPHPHGGYGSTGGHHHHRSSPYPAYHPWATPPAPPQLPLSALSQQHVVPSSTPNTNTVKEGIDETSLRSAKQQVEEVEKRCREYQERKRTMQRNAFEKVGGSRCSSSSAASSLAPVTTAPCYAPLYSVPPPPPSTAKALDIPEPVTATVSATEGEKKDAWTGVKGLLKTFVRDLNRHLADQFGEGYGEFGFEVREGEKEDGEVEKKQEKDKEVEVEEKKNVRAVHNSVFCDRCVYVPSRSVLPWLNN